MSETTARITLVGRETGFLETLKKSVESTASLATNTDSTNKSFLALNKTAKESDSILKSLAEGSLKTAKGFASFSRSSLDFGKSTVTNSERLIDLNDTIDTVTSGISGFGLRLLRAKKPLDSFNSVLDGPAGHLRDIADAANGTERAFIILDKLQKPLTKGISLLGKRLDSTGKFFRGFEKAVASTSANALKVGTVALNGLNVAVKSLQDNIGKQGFFGRIVSAQLAGVSKSVQDATQKTERLSESLNPKNFKKADLVGDKLANIFKKSSEAAEQASISLKLADYTGDVYRAGLGLTRFVKDNVIPTGQALVDVAPKFLMLGQLALSGQNNFLNLGQSADSLNKVIRNSFLQTISRAALGLGYLTVVVNQSRLAFSALFVDFKANLSGLTDAFEIFQNMGIDTTAAEAALQFGLFGEKLLFNIEASKKFAKAAAQSFAEFEQSVSFVTTLSAGVNASFRGMEAGIESVGAAAQALATGPLKNAVTAGEATEAMYNALSAGIGVAKDGTADLTKTNQFMEASLKLSSATGSDAAQTMEILAKANGIYGRSNAEAEKTAAQLYGIVQEGITTFPQLAGGLGRVLSVAEAADISIEEASGSIAGLTKVMTTDDAMTGYTSLLASIAGQGEQSAKAVAELGIKFDSQTVASKGLLVSLRELAQATNGNQETLKKIIPDMLAFTTATNLMGVAGQDAANIMGNIQTTGENAGEALNKLFDGRQLTIIQRSANLMNGFNAILTEFGSRALKILEPGLALLEEILDGFQRMPGFLKTGIGILIVVQATFGRILTAGLGIVGFFGKLFVSFTIGNLLMKAFTGNLKREIAGIQVLANIEKDFVGVLLKLIGLNGKYSKSTATIAQAKAKQLKVEKKLQEIQQKSNLIKPGDLKITKGLVESYEKAITEVQKKLKELRSSDLQSVSPKLYAEEKKRLKRFLKDLREAQGYSVTAQKQAVSDFNSNVTKTLTLTTTTISQKKQDVAEALGRILSVFGTAGELIAEQLVPDIEAVLDDVALTTAQQSEKISALIKKMAGKTELKSIKEGLLSIDQNFKGFFIALDRTTDQYGNKIKASLASVLDTSYLGDIDKTLILKKFGLLFNSLNSTADEKKVLLRSTFKEIADSLPKAFAGVTPKLLKELDEMMDKTDFTLERRGEMFSRRMRKEMEGMDLEVARGIAPLVASMKRLVEEVETPLSGFDILIDTTQVKARNSFSKFAGNVVELKQRLMATNLKEIIGSDFKEATDYISATLTDASLTTQEKTQLISKRLAEIGKGASVQAKASLANLRNTVNTQLEELDKESYDQLKQGASKIKGVVDESTGAIRQAVGESNTQLSLLGDPQETGSGDKLARLVNQVKSKIESIEIKEKVAQINQIISSIGGEQATQLELFETPEKVESTLGKIKNVVASQIPKIKASYSQLFESLPEEAKAVQSQLELALEETLVEGIEQPLDAKKTIFRQKYKELARAGSEAFKQYAPLMKVIMDDTLTEIDQAVQNSNLDEDFDILFGKVKGKISVFSGDAAGKLKKLWVNLDIPEGVKGRLEGSITEVAASFEKLKTGGVTVEEVQATINTEVEQLNLSLEEIADQPTRDKVKAHIVELRTDLTAELNKAALVADKKFQQINKSAKQSTEGLRDMQSGARGLLFSLGGFANLPMGELFDLSEFAIGAGKAMKASSDSAEGLAAASELVSVGAKRASGSVAAETLAFNANRKSLGLLEAVNLILTGSIWGKKTATDADTVSILANTGVTNVNTAATVGNTAATNASIIAEKAHAISQTTLTGVKRGFGKATLFVGGALLGFKKAIFNLPATLLKIKGALISVQTVGLGPIAIALVAAVAAWNIFKTVILDNIPGVRMLTNEYARMENRIEKTTEKLKALGKIDSDEFTLPAKEYSKSWLTSLDGVAEGISQGSNKLMEFLRLQDESATKANAVGIRETYNERKATARRSRSNKALKKLAVQRTRTLKLATENEEETDIIEKGGVITQTAKDLVKAANDANRALSGSEFAKVLEEEQKGFEERKKIMEDNLSLLTEQLEIEEKKKKPDPDIVAGLREQTEALEDQISAAEKANTEWIEYANTIQAFVSTVELNDATKGMENYIQKLENMLNSDEIRRLPENVKDTYKELTNVTSEIINLADPEKTREEIMELTGLSSEQIEKSIAESKTSFEKITKVTSNLTNSMQRRGSAAKDTAIAAALTLSVDVADPDIKVTLDQAQIKIKDAALAIQEQVDQNAMTEERGEVDIEKVLTTKFVVDPEGISDPEQRALAEQLNGKNFRDILSPQDLDEIFENNIKIQNSKFERFVKDRTSQINQINTLEKKGQITSVEAEEKRQAIQETIADKELETKNKILQANREYYGPQSQIVKDLEIELTDFLSSQADTRLENAKTMVEKRSKVREAEINALDLEKKDLSIDEAKGNITKLKMLQDTAEAEEKIDKKTLASKKDYLDTLLLSMDENAEEVKAARLDIAKFESEVDLKRFEEKKDIIEEEFNLIKKRFEVEKLQAQNVDASTNNAADIRRKILDQETKVRSSQLSLEKAFSDYQSSNLQNRAKLTGDLTEKAEIDLQLARDKQVLLNRELEAEEQSLIVNQELNSLGLEREESQLRINKLEAENSKLELKSRLNKKTELGLQQEEIDLLEAQLEAAGIQSGFIDDQISQLDTVISQQDSINDRERQAFQLRRQASVESANIEAELAARNLIISKYEQQKKEVLLQNEIEEVGSQARIAGLENAEKILSSQLGLIEKQKGLIDGITSSIQAAYNIAIQAEQNQFKKRRLEREAAELQLATLKKQQEFEKISFDLQVQQKDLALERQRIELEIAKAKGQADLAVARAEAAIVAADPTKSTLEKQAAQAKVTASEFSLSALDQQSALLTQQSQIETATRGIERQSFNRSQRDQLLQAQSGVANTTLRRSDDRQIARRALSFAREDANLLPEVISQFASNLQTVLPSPQSTIGQQALSQATPTVQRNTSLQEPSFGGNIKVDLVLDVKGNTEGLDKRELQQKISQGVEGGFTEFFETLRLRSRR